MPSWTTSGGDAGQQDFATCPQKATDMRLRAISGSQKGRRMQNAAGIKGL
eukprot:CAMPEP_0117479750 /NCGR_PEP_ID=MMETSP0784-20121206/12044_1 /TAXON_ID=39447 /ORGANISM="" /LENGTH=49 /DNA_ID=CAMNT_0005274183 /DNA_START=181 /DNA_END=330 /DNA_ORIENTATION=+